MSRYEIYLMLHIAFATAWVGAGFLLHVQGFRAVRSGDVEGMRRAIFDTGALAPTVFIPSSMGALLLGLLMVFDGPWSFSDLWIGLGLVGFATSFCLGMFMLKPRAEQFVETFERDGGMSPAAIAKAKEIMTIGRIEFVVLVLVVADMALKPSLDNIVTLAAMIAVLVAGTGLVLAKARNEQIPEGAGA